MSTAISVLAVDDNSINLRLFQEILKDHDLQVAQSGGEALILTQQKLPHVILLDVNMPEFDGYETCKEIRATNLSCQPFIIFVSAADSIEEKVKGYELGGDDYVTRPFEPEVLRCKVQVGFKVLQQRQQLTESIQEISKVAQTAMTASSEMGVVTQFIQQSCFCKSLKDLANAIFFAMNSYGLHTVVQIHFGVEVYNFAPNQKVRPLEEQILSALRDKGRILNLEKRLIINYPNVSILIKNMPEHDEDRAGRLRDLLTALASATDSRVEAINNEKRLVRVANLSPVIEKTYHTLENIQRLFESNYGNVVDAINNLGINIEAQFFSLGLENDQEKELMGIIDQAAKEMITALGNQDKITENFQSLLHTLHMVKEQQDKLGRTE